MVSILLRQRVDPREVKDEVKNDEDFEVIYRNKN